MSDLPIYIPSRGRACLIGGILSPTRWIPPARRKDTIFIVPDSEVGPYRRILNNLEMPEIRVIPVPDQMRIAEKRLWIGNTAADFNQERFLCLDDDIKIVCRKNFYETGLRKTSVSDIENMMYHIDHNLEDAAHVSVSLRQGNNNLGPCAEGEYITNTRTCRVLGYQTHAFLGVEHCRVDVMEDFDVHLQMLEQGQEIRSLSFYASEQSGTNTRGGCSLWRTHELHDASARRLVELHPGVIRLTEKKNKTGGDFGHRTEVVIGWKKAAEIGRKKS